MERKLKSWVIIVFGNRAQMFLLFPDLKDNFSKLLDSNNNKNSGCWRGGRPAASLKLNNIPMSDISSVYI